MKRILWSVILVVILALLNGLAFADFDSNSANITHQYFPVKKWDWFKYVGYGNMTGETETFEFLGTEFVESVNCLKFEVEEDGDVATAWIAQDTDGNVWFLKIIISEGVFTLGSGISNPFFYAEPKVGDILSQIFPESAGTYSEVTEIGVDVNLSTGLGPYENCIEITSYFDYEVEDLSYYCSGIGLVKIIYPQEGPPETGRELSEFGNDGPEFEDVPPGYWAEEFIEEIYDEGITSGCSQNPLMYCPEDPVTRAEMAVFLERGINGSDYDPPGATGVFDDCPVSHWAADWVEQFYADGITSGCSQDPLLYCPDDLVTRAQMAVFLLRSMYGSGYTPPSAEGIFDDVPVTHWASDWIEQLYDEGITGGCSTDPPLYCPDDLVTRAQMAVFIVRAFDL